MLEKINPKHFLKPITFQVKPISIIRIENKIRIQSDIENSFTFYMSNAISIKRDFEKKEELLVLNKEEYWLKGNQDLVIKGLGFIHIKKACKLSVYIKEKELLEVRTSMFKEN